ncbi:unnamed protein product, partial [Prorocentrum cordatum]
RVEQDQHRREKRIERLEADLAKVVERMQSLANQRAELEQYIAAERKAMEEAKAAAAERLRHADRPAADPDLAGLRRQMEEFQHVLAGVQAGELRESLEAKYQNILEMLPPKPVPQPAATAFVSTEMVVDEADLEEACMAAGVGSDAVKRGLLEALLQ